MLKEFLRQSPNIGFKLYISDIASCLSPNQSQQEIAQWIQAFVKPMGAIGYL